LRLLPLRCSGHFALSFPQATPVVSLHYGMARLKLRLTCQVRHPVHIPPPSAFSAVFLLTMCSLGICCLYISTAIRSTFNLFDRSSSLHSAFSHFSLYSHISLYSRLSYAYHSLCSLSLC